MNRAFKILVIVAALLTVVGWSAETWAGGTAVVSRSSDDKLITWACTSASDDGSLSGTGVQSIDIDGYIVQVEVIPGSVTPTAGYDVDLNLLVSGIVEDLTGTLFDNCSTSTITRETPVTSQNGVYKRVRGSLYPSAASCGNSKTFYIRVWLQ